ncbi:unnamed protein product [Agarophyton chilense]|eukprot:gb/GEZJ01001591.1/.p2 GENE.gb/GEZJ01001591.1/~~gb/GEZJ01001591.1/.p2  ORF type:complete len:102 (+),score=26.39 gb/GEZJ01001591.1/:250-555(+)
MNNKSNIQSEIEAKGRKAKNEMKKKKKHELGKKHENPSRAQKRKDSNNISDHSCRAKMKAKTAAMEIAIENVRRQNEMLEQENSKLRGGSSSSAKYPFYEL